MKFFRRVWDNGMASFTTALDEENAVEKFNDQCSDCGETTEEQVEEVKDMSFTLEQDEEGEWIAFLSEEHSADLEERISDALEEDFEDDEDEDDSE